MPQVLQAMKRVRFSECLDVCHLPPDENRRENWYNKKDYHAFIMDSFAAKRKIEKRSELITALEDAHQKCLSLAGSLSNEYEEEAALLHLCHQKVRRTDDLRRAMLIFSILPTACSPFVS
jgi:hypothetical protein